MFSKDYGKDYDLKQRRRRATLLEEGADRVIEVRKMYLVPAKFHRASKTLQSCPTSVTAKARAHEFTYFLTQNAGHSQLQQS